MKEHKHHRIKTDRIPLLAPTMLISLPRLYSQEHVSDPVALAHFYLPGTDWHWYPVEFDGKDLFFDLVFGFERELGYFALSELESIIGPLGLGTERDLNFRPTPLSQIRRQHGK